MLTERSRSVERLDGPPDDRADRYPAPGRNADAADRRAAAPAQGSVRHDLGAPATRIGAPAAPSGGRYHGGYGRGRSARVPAGRLALAVRHRAGAGSALGTDAGADQRPRACCPDVLAGPLAAGGSPLSPPIPVPADGAQRRL